jgi:hypothetical protein
MHLCSLNDDALLKILEYCDTHSICNLCDSFKHIHALVRVSQNHVCMHLLRTHYNVTRIPDSSTWSRAFFEHYLEEFGRRIEDGVTCKQIKAIAKHFSTFGKMDLMVQFIDEKQYIALIHNYLLKQTKILFDKKNWEKKSIAKLPILFLSFGCRYDAMSFVNATLCRDKKSTKFMLKHFDLLKDSLVLGQPMIFYMKQYYLLLKHNGKMSSGNECFANSIINTLLNKNVLAQWDDGSRTWSFPEYCTHLETQLSIETVIDT